MLKHRLLENLNESDVQLFKIRNFDANQIIYNEGAICENIDFLIQGNVVISTLSYSGKEEFFNTFKDNDVFGNVLIFTKEPYYLGDVISKSSNTIIASITKQNLLLLFSTNKEFLELYLKEICNETLESKKDKKMLLQKTISDRVIYYLKQHGGKLKIASITALANDLSYPRPSMSRTINKMIDQNIIEYKNGVISLK